MDFDSNLTQIIESRRVKVRKLLQYSAFKDVYNAEARSAKSVNLTVVLSECTFTCTLIINSANFRLKDDADHKMTSNNV